MAKKLLFLMGLLLVLCTSKAQIVNVPDTIFKTYLITSPEINTNGDNEIQTSEALAFTGTVDCNNANITNLTGIEAFVNITKLLCYDNQLTSLDVSHNTALTNLQCDGNQLENLDVSNNTALVILWCNSNRLATLNVEENKVLKDLRCYDNQLTDLSIDNNTNLERLYVHLNQLTNLDLSMNVLMKDLFCSWNQLTRLNIKNGNNAALRFMLAKNNSNLSCIQVDDVANANAYSNWAKDLTASYNSDCNDMSVADDNKNSISFYPNPAKEILHFSEEVSTIKIFDFLGKVRKEFTAATKSIQVADLAKGIYIVAFKTRSEKNIIQKFIKN